MLLEIAVLGEARRVRSLLRFGGDNKEAAKPDECDPNLNKHPSWQSTMHAMIVNHGRQSSKKNPQNTNRLNLRFSFAR
jgi:hypothetical protein